MSRFNTTKVSSRFFNSNNHTLPVTFYNKFSANRLTDSQNSNNNDSLVYLPDSKTVIYPPANAYFWKGSTQWEDPNNVLTRQKFVSWWPLQTVEDNKLVLRWTSITTKDYKFDSTLTKTRVSTKNSAEISQWHYPKMVEPGFSYAVYGRTSQMEANTTEPLLTSWNKYGVVKDEPDGVMEFIFNDRQRNFEDEDAGATAIEKFQWMIVVENTNVENLVSNKNFGTGIPDGYSETVEGDALFNYASPHAPWAVTPPFGASQWVVAMSPYKRNALAKYSGLTSVGARVNNLFTNGWKGINVVLVNNNLPSPFNNSHLPTTSGAEPYRIGSSLYAWEGNWDNSVGTGKSLGWLEDVLNFAGREIETKYAFKGFNGESISALHHLDTSSNEDFTGMFQDASNFNQDISFLDFSSADFMEDMFQGANNYMQDMSGWNTL